MLPFADILIATKWLLAIYLCSIAGMLVFIKAGNNSLLRISLGRAAGIVGVAAITWLLSILKIAPFDALTIFVVVLVVCIIALGYRKTEILKALKKHKKNYLILESVFIGLFIVAVTIRASSPKIEGVEKFMDAALLSGLMRHNVRLPVDTWYAPESVNYYYFGHWIIAMMAKISRTTIDYAFNLGFATTIAMAGSAFFAVGWQLSKKVIGGFLTVFMVFFASNLHPFINLLQGKEGYFFYNSGRFIEYEINEYPFYSLMLGDLHAHMLSLMLTSAIVVAICLIAVEKSNKARMAISATAGAIAGLLSLTNAFDVITAGLLFGGLLIWFYWKKKLSNKEILYTAMAFAALFLFFFIIIMFSFKPAVGGVAIALFKTPLVHIVWQFGAVIALIGISAYIINKKRAVLSAESNVRLAIIALLAMAGIALLLMPQFVYFKDIYHYQNPPFARANTVFKLWYAAWPLLAISASTLIVIWLSSLKSKQLLRALIFLVVVVAVVGYGTLVGFNSLGDGQADTLNGLKYLKQNEPQKIEVIKWAQETIQGQPLVAQAYGESYSTQSWFSSYTGLPSIMGWRSHEWGWRYTPQQWDLIGARINSLKSIYESASSRDLIENTSSYDISYILIGPDERVLYSINDVVFEGTFGQAVFSNNLYKVYKVK